MIHQIIGQSKDSKAGMSTIHTKCGQKHHRNSAAPIPADLTGWGSEVTCPECLR